MKKISMFEVLRKLKKAKEERKVHLGEWQSNFSVTNEKESLVIYTKEGRVIHKILNEQEKIYTVEKKERFDLFKELKEISLIESSEGLRIYEFFMEEEKFLLNAGIKDEERKKLKRLCKMRRNCIKLNQMEKAEEITKEIIRTSGVEMDIRQNIAEDTTTFLFTEGEVTSGLKISNEIIKKTSKTTIDEKIFQHFLEYHGFGIDED